MRLKSRRTNRYRNAACFAVESLENRTLLSAGDLDPTFGSGGKILLPDHNGSVNYSVNTTAVQGDGKILLAGAAASSSSTSFFLERLNIDGSIDMSFGTNGIVVTSLSNLSVANSILIQGDGKILLGGTQETDQIGTNAQFALARYNTNGTLDTTFGGGGIVLTRIPGQESLLSIALTPEGKIVAGGLGTYQDPAHPTDSSYSAHVFDVARYNTNGSLDTTFGTGGFIYRQVQGPGYGSDFNTYQTLAVAVQGDDKVLVGSHYQIDFAVWRFDTDGTLDTSFGLSGMATTPFPYVDANDNYDWGSVSKMLVQSNGQILVAGPRNSGNFYATWALSRFNSDGTLDTSFGQQGLLVPALNPGNAPSGEGDPPGGLALQSDGKIIVGGVDNSYQVGVGSFRIDRLLANGATDPTFHSSEFSYFDGPTQMDFSRVGATALAPDGRIVIAGNDSNGGSTPGIAVIRLQGDTSPAATTAATPSNPSGNIPGDLDASFGFQGRTLLNDPSPVELPNALTPRVKATAVLQNGQILLAGSIGAVANNGQGQFYLERLNSNGTVDTAFGSGGFVTTTIGPNAFATSMLVLSNGEIILGGATDDSATAPTNANFALVRYNANGSIDSTFGSGGIVITDFPGNEEIDSLALSPNGQIIAAGAYFLYPNVGFDVARYNANGLLDGTFNGTGMLSYNLAQTGSDSFPPALGVQADQKVVVGSHSGNEFALYRFNANGSIDQTFGRGGVATVTNASRASGIATTDGGISGAVTRLAIQPDGKIIAAGQTPLWNTPYAIARFNVDGTMDTGFGTNGQEPVNGNYGPGGSAIYPLAGLLLQSSGEIILVGNQASLLGGNLINPGPQLLMRKYLPDGTADPYFDPDQDPLYLPPPPVRGELAESAAFTPSGELVVASDIWSDATSSAIHWLGVARFLNNTDYYNVTKLTDDGSIGTFRWSMNQAAATYPGATVGFQPGLNGTITLANGIAESGNTGATVWIKGPGAPLISISGAINTTGSISVSGVTLLSGGVAANGSSSYTDATIHGEVSAQYANIKVLVLRCTFLGDNTASYGLIAGQYSGASVEDSTFTGYTSAAVIGGPDMTVINCTIYGNSGLGIQSASLSIGNTIVAGNGGSQGPDVFNPVISLGHNLIGNDSNSTGWVSSDLLGTSNGPIDPQLLPLGYYGGPTQTMPPRVGSPAIDAGDDLLLPASLQTDQRGFDRTLGFRADPSISGGNVDIGSVETSYVTINGTSGSDTIYLQGANPPGDVYWSIGNVSHAMSANDPLGSLTINGNGGSDIINIDYSQGKPLPTNLHLNGSFTINGMSGSNPLAGTNLEIGRSTIYVSYANAAADPIAAVRQYLQAGFNNGAWNGIASSMTGVITSLAAAQNAAHTTAIGYADSADGLISGQPVNTIELKYTLYGDTTLSGTVGFNDFTRMTQHYKQTSGASWDTGDFNYDGSVNSADFTLMSRTYNTSLGSQATPASAHVAQPPSAVFRRRRKSH